MFAKNWKLSSFVAISVLVIWPIFVLNNGCFGASVQKAETEDALFGLTLPPILNITLPHLPNITLPHLPNITLPHLPNITLPHLPNITLPETQSNSPIITRPAFPSPLGILPELLNQVTGLLQRIIKSVVGLLGRLFGIPTSLQIEQIQELKAFAQVASTYVQDSDQKQSIEGNLIKSETFVSLLGHFQQIFQDLLQQVQALGVSNEASVQELVSKLDTVFQQLSFYSNYVVSVIKTQPLSIAQQIAGDFSNILQNISSLSEVCSQIQNSQLKANIRPLFAVLEKIVLQIEQSLSSDSCEASKQILCSQIASQVQGLHSNLQACIQQ